MISGPLTCEADGFAMGSGADMRRTNETYWMYLCLVIVKLREVQLSLWSAWSLLYRQKWGLLLFWVYFTAAQYPLPEEWSSRPAHFLLLPPVWWVLAETCCLGSSIMHPLPRDIMCDKWPISVQTPIGPWPGGGLGVRACVRKSVYVCFFAYESRFAVGVWEWDGEEVRMEVMLLVFYKLMDDIELPERNAGATGHLPSVDVWMHVCLYSGTDVAQGKQDTNSLLLYVSYCFSYIPVLPSQSLLHAPSSFLSLSCSSLPVRFWTWALSDILHNCLT